WLDTAIIVGVMIGSVVAIALVFGKTVLSVAWTGNDTKRLTAVQNGNKNKIVQEHLQEKNEISRMKGFSKLSKDNDNRITSLPRSQKVLTLLNKEVSTCDNVIIGSISALNNGLMLIIHAPQNIKYEIPTYFVRQHGQNSVLVDISAADLEYYKPKISF
ncbi:MAG: hypothetical protein WCD28_07635, partial [Nitrososphaeraceae archaeon]